MDKQLEAESWGQRIRMFKLVPSLLLHLIRRPQDREWLTSEGMPADAQFVAATYDDMWRLFRVYVISETFDLVPEGQAVPEMEITFTVHYPETRPTVVAPLPGDEA